MKILLGLLVLLIFFQWVGDVILQIDLKRRKYQICPYTLIEHASFSTVIGITLSSFISMAIVRIIPFSLYIFIAVVSIITIGLMRLFQIKFTQLWWLQFWIFIKNFQFTSENRQKSLYIIVSGGLALLLYLGLFTITRQNNIQPNHDLFVYIHHTLDAIRNGWNFYDPNYLGTFYASKIFQFLLLPFIALEPTAWYSIIWDYLPVVQFGLFYAMILSLLHRVNGQNNYYVVIGHAAALFFSSWFIYLLPTNWNLLIVLILIQLFLGDEICSYELGGILVIAGLCVHFSTILFVGIPFGIALIVRFKKNPQAFPVFKSIQTRWQQIPKKLKYLVIIGIIGGIIGGLWYFWSTVQNIITTYFSIQRTDLDLQPFYEKFGIWIRISSILIGFGLIWFIKKVKPEENLKNRTFLYVFIIAFSVYMYIIFMNYDLSRLIIRSLYLPYRFQIIFEFSLLLLGGIGVGYLIRLDWNRILHRDHQNPKSFITLTHNQLLNNILILLIVSGICIPLIIRNVKQNYQFLQFTQYWPSTYIEAMNFITEDAGLDPVYSYNEASRIIQWNIIHTYLGDYRCIDLGTSRYYYNDSRYATDNLDSNANYANFQEFFFNSSKSIYSYAANYRNLPEEKKQSVKIDYLLLDTDSNPFLITLLLNDTEHFQQIYTTTGKWGGIEHLVVIFQPRTESVI